MATDKTTKDQDSGGGCRPHARYSGLMALESRLLFSAAPLVGDLPGPESANDGAPAIEASLLPDNKPGVDLGQINNLVPTPPVPGLVPTPEKHLTHHQSKDAHLNQVALKKHTHAIINPQFKGRGDGQRIGISPIPTPTPGGGGGSVMVVNPDSMRPADNPEGSNPTPHPMPVPELSDSVSKRRLEHGPGLANSVLDSVMVINPDSMRPTANSFRGCLPTDPCQLRGQTIGKADSFFDIFTELSRVGDEPRDIVGSAQVVNPDSMRPADNPEGSNPTPHPMPVPELSDSVSKRRLEHGPGLANSVLDSVMVINPDSMRPIDAQWIGISPIPTPTPGGGSVMVLNPDSMRPADNPEGSNPTPHPMPVPELSDSVSKRRLEHGPGLHDSVLDLVGMINPDSMRPTANGIK